MPDVTARSPVITSASSLCPFPDTPAMPSVSPARTSSWTSRRAGQPFVPNCRDAAQLEHWSSRGSGRLGDDVGCSTTASELATYHQPGQRAPVGLCGRRRRHDPAVAQHADAIGDLEHFVQLVRDEDDGEALRRQAAHGPQQAPRLLGREHRGRFVEDEDASAEVEQAQDLDPLLLSD